MKITCTIELEVEDDITAEAVITFEDCLRHWLSQDWGFWKPKVSVDPVSGVDTGSCQEPSKT